MASYENLMTFSEAWFFDDFAEEIQTPTAALQTSFSGDSSHGDVLSAEIAESLFSIPAQTPTVSCGSEGEIVASRHRRGGVPPTGKVAKRKPRGSKRSATTTFIIADRENFRQMVQRVTGARLCGLDEQLSVFEPGRINGVGGLLSPPPVLADEGLFDSDCSFPTLESWNV